MYELTAPKIDPEAQVYSKEPTWPVYAWARDFKEWLAKDGVDHAGVAAYKVRSLETMKSSVDALSPEGKQALDAITTEIKTKVPYQYIRSLPGLLDALLATDPTNPKSPAIVFDWARRFLEESKKVKAEYDAGRLKGLEIGKRVHPFTIYKWNDPATPLVRASKLLPPDAQEALREARQDAAPDDRIKAITRFLEFERGPGGAGPAAAGAGGPAAAGAGGPAVADVGCTGGRCSVMGGRRRKTKKGKSRKASRRLGRHRYSRRR